MPEAASLRPFRRRSPFSCSAAVLALVALSLAGCGGGAATPRVLGIGPETLVGSAGGEPFVVTWDSAGAASTVPGQGVVVRFTAVAGTPFEGGASRTVDVQGTVLDERRVAGSSPPSSATARAFITLILPGTGMEVVSETSIAEIVSNPPVATDETYDAIGNVGLGRGHLDGVLQGDFDPDGDPIAVLPATGPTAEGGAVSIAADGSFTYEPPTGFAGVDTFTYTITDGVLEAMATVAMRIDEVVWFIDARAQAGGDGRFSAPFVSLAAFNNVQGGAARSPGPGDTIFIYQNGATPYAGHLSLLDDQLLVGQGVDLMVGGRLLVARTDNPVIEATGGFTVEAAARTEIRGLDLVNAEGGGVRRLASLGDGFLTMDEIGILTTGGPALLSNSGENVTYTIVLDNADVNDSHAGGIVLHGGHGLLHVGEARLRVTGGADAALDFERSGLQVSLGHVDISSATEAVDFDGATGSLEINSGFLEAAGSVVSAINAGGPVLAPARIELADAELVQTGAVSTPALDIHLTFPAEERFLDLIVTGNDLYAAHGIQVAVTTGDGAPAAIRCLIEGNRLSGSGNVTLLGSLSGRLDAVVERNVGLPGAVLSVISEVEGLVCARIEENAFDLFVLTVGDDAAFGIACSDGLCTIADDADAVFAVALRNTGDVNAASGVNGVWYECSDELRTP